MARGEAGRKSRSSAPLPEIPDKLYFRIGEVARLLALPSYVLRFWETEFPHLKPNKGGTGQRLYRRRDVDALLEIRRLLYDEGYTIPGARQFLRDKARAPEPALPLHTGLDDQSVPPATAAKLRGLRRELHEIAELLERPVAGIARPNAAHRGLHLAMRKRSRHDAPPTLFALPLHDESGDEPQG